MVINLFKNLIENYINNMTINDIIMFSKKENILLTNEEYDKIFNYIKSNWKSLINNQEKVENFLNENFDFEKKDKIYNLFLKYQKKYSSYL